MTHSGNPDDSQKRQTNGDLPVTEIQRGKAHKLPDGGFSDSNGETTQPSESQDDLMPHRIGHFEIKERLGSGGMGVVFLAEQKEPIHRQVALKLMRRTLIDNESRLRFDAERQALARLAHANIAQIYEAGTTDEGHPYFAMEAVVGTQIIKYCDQHRLSLAQRLILFQAACEGVQHAHHKGIIHRDLKPSNILVTEVDGRPVPKIIDFGIAKALDQPLVEVQDLTGHWIVGTPSYLAPEVLEQSDSSIDVDTRVDVYALGVILYELLVGVLPHDVAGAPIAQMMRRFASELPTEPSTRWKRLDNETRQEAAESRLLDAASIHRHLKGDLDWIVMRSIARDREQRYHSPAELAADIGRHLRHEPVEAGPPSASYRLKKFVRRHRGATISGFLVAVSLIAGLVAVDLQARRANREAQAARLAQIQAEEVTRFMVDLFELADPGETFGAQVTAQQLLDRGADRVVSELADQPRVRARLLNAMGSAYQGLGFYRRAVDLIEESIEIEERLGDRDTLDLAGKFNDLGEANRLLGNNDEAEALFRRSIEICQSVGGVSRSATADTVNNLGLLFLAKGQLDEAEECFNQALNDLEFDLGPKNIRVATVLNNLGSLAGERGRLDEAKSLHQRALEIFEEVGGPNHPDVAMAVNNLGLLNRHLGLSDQVEPLLRRALEIWTASLGPDHPNVATVLSNLASYYSNQKRYSEAEPLLEEALAISERQLGPDHPSTAQWCFNLAQVRKMKGDLGGALSLLERSRMTLEASLGEDHASVSYPLMALADVYNLQGDLDRSRRYYRQAIDLRERALPPGHRLVVDALSEYAGVLKTAGESRELQAVESRLEAVLRLQESENSTDRGDGE